jgi:hypothetical protein
MQDIGGKKDTELSKENLTLCWREFSVESLDTVSLLEIGCCFPRGFARNLEPISQPPKRGSSRRYSKRCTANNRSTEWNSCEFRLTLALPSPDGLSNDLLSRSMIANEKRASSAR